MAVMDLIITFKKVVKMEISVFKSDPAYLPLIVMLETTHEGKKYTSKPIQMMPEEWSNEKENELKTKFKDDVISKAKQTKQYQHRSTVIKCPQCKQEQTAHKRRHK